MLSVSTEQLRALEAQAQSDAIAAIGATFWLRRREFPSLKDSAYLSRVVDIAVRGCRSRGWERVDTWAGCVESLLKDEPAPLPADRLDSKLSVVLRELQAQQLFAMCCALELGQGAARPGADRASPEGSAER